VVVVHINNFVLVRTVQITLQLLDEGISGGLTDTTTTD